MNVSQQVDHLCDAFEAQWKAGKRPSIRDAVQQASETIYEPLLSQLVLLDIEYRLNAQEDVAAKDYAAFGDRYVDLAAAELTEADTSQSDALADTHTFVEDNTNASTLLPSATDTPPRRLSVETVVLPERFQVLSELGAGGMGVVYRVLDTQRQSEVALKLLPDASADAVSRFKREFRTLANLSHRNLVNLFELFAEQDCWFFTMEVIDGVDFLAHPAVAKARADSSHVAELRNCFLQLVQGLLKLHDAGQIHRDVKPSNVLVTAEGRVVVTDFGLAATLNPVSWRETMNAEIGGTVSYMAPEQVIGEPCAASDWYAVGVILFQALTGQLPFSGSMFEVLDAKKTSDPPPVQSLATDIPEDLAKLCSQLLSRQPDLRPSAAQILRCFDDQAQNPSAGPTSVEAHRLQLPVWSIPDQDRRPLIGRESEMAALQTAFKNLRAGQGSIVQVQGESGFGKSALVDNFLHDIVQNDADTVILAGCCYEREAIPFKALDGVMDALSRRLRTLNETDAALLLPRHIAALARLFPAFERVDLVQQRMRDSRVPQDHQELRKRAVDAVRDMLGRLADQQPLIVFIDDLQWGDVDSVRILQEVLSDDDAPALLLITTFRPESIEHNACLNEWNQWRQTDSEHLTSVLITVGELSATDAERLARSFLPADAFASDSTKPDTTHTDRLQSMTAQAAGNPFLIQEIAEFAAQSATTQTASLTDVIRYRVQEVSPTARQVLELVAVAGRPQKQQVVFAATPGMANPLRDLNALCAHRLVKTSGSNPDDLVQPYHDQIRESVVDRMTEDRSRQLHLALAESLQDQDGQQFEALAFHWEHAGHTESAVQCLEKAGQQALQQLAFDTAAEHFQHALHLQTSLHADAVADSTLAGTEAADEENRRTRLLIQYADALAYGGIGNKAGDAYLQASQRETELTALDLQRKAAEQYLVSGRLKQGAAQMTQVLQAHGIATPVSWWAKIAAVIRGQLQLRWQGTEFSATSEDQIPPRKLARVDVCWSATMGLSIVDPIQGMNFQTQGLLNAVAIGESRRIARALIWETVFLATAGTKGPQARIQKFQDQFDAINAGLDDPYLDALSELVSGMRSYLGGEWPTAQKHCEQAEAMFRENCLGAAWELDTAQSFGVWALYQRGDIAGLNVRLPTLVSEAETRGNWYALHNHASAPVPLVRLAADDITGAQQKIDQIRRVWEGTAFHIQDANLLRQQIDVDLYQNDIEAAVQHADQFRRLLRKSGQSQIQMLRGLADYLYGQALLASGDRSPRVHKQIAAMAKRLRNENVTWATAYHRLLLSGLTSRSGDSQTAEQHLQQAIECFERVGMVLRAAAAKCRLGAMTGGSKGRALQDAGYQQMQQHGIANPDRMTDMLIPIVG